MPFSSKLATTALTFALTAMACSSSSSGPTHEDTTNDAGGDSATVTDSATPTDSGMPGDSSTPSDSAVVGDGSTQGEAGPFACGNATCDPTTQVCATTEGGADTGAGPTVVCMSIPSACSATPTCACLQSNLSTWCSSGILSCTISGDQISVVCMNA